MCRVLFLVGVCYDLNKKFVVLPGIIGCYALHLKQDKIMIHKISCTLH